VTHQTVTENFPTAPWWKAYGDSRVYFVRIGKHIKIGVTTNLDERIKSFEGASAETIQVLAAFPGDRNGEQYLHDLFRGSRIRNEFFHFDFEINCFLSIAKEQGLHAALQWAKAWKAQEQERQARRHKIQERRSKAAYREMMVARRSNLSHQQDHRQHHHEKRKAPALTGVGAGARQLLDETNQTPHSSMRMTHDKYT
jgi:sRNA-binding protein